MQNKKINPEIKISGLMSIYHGTRRDELELSVGSIFNQTVQLDEMIIVIDGPINNDLACYLEEIKSKIIIVKIKENQGLWNALNEGLKYCSYKYVARFDSDDYFYKDRIQIQKDYLQLNSSVDILGSYMDEFIDSPNNCVSQRQVPTGDNIKRFARSRSPLNHISVIFKRDKIIEIGGYENVNYLEDYHLWLKAIDANLEIENIKTSTCSARISQFLYQRRSGLLYVKSSLKLAKLKFKVYGLRDYPAIVVFSFLWITLRFLPVWQIKILYRFVRH